MFLTGTLALRWLISLALSFALSTYFHNRTSSLRGRYSDVGVLSIDYLKDSSVLTDWRFLETGGLRYLSSNLRGKRLRLEKVCCRKRVDL